MTIQDYSKLNLKEKRGCLFIFDQKSELKEVTKSLFSSLSMVYTLVNLQIAFHWLI